MAGFAWKIQWRRNSKKTKRNHIIIFKSSYMLRFAPKCPPELDGGINFGARVISGEIEAGDGRTHRRGGWIKRCAKMRRTRRTLLNNTKANQPGASQSQPHSQPRVKPEPGQSQTRTRPEPDQSQPEPDQHPARTRPGQKLNKNLAKSGKNLPKSGKNCPKTPP